MGASPGGERRLSLLSVVVACLDEEQVIRETHRRLVSALDGPGLDFEIVYVDDGSRDSTLDILRELQRAEPRVKVVSLTRNFGQFAALTAGMEHAAGDAVALIDADLQDPPEAIGEMLELWRHGADIVHGLRTKRLGESKFKIWTSRAFIRVINKLSDTRLEQDVGEFGVMDRAVVDAFLSMPESQRYVLAMLSWTGFRREMFPYERQPRYAGKTKYTLKKMVGTAVYSMLSFSIIPLRVATLTGLLFSVLSFLGIIYTLAVRLLTDAWIPGWAIVFISILTLGGLQLIFLGLIGEYLGRTYIEVKRRPLYLVRERMGFAPGRGRE